MKPTILTGEFSVLYTNLGTFAPQRVRKYIPFAERVAYSESGRAKHRASPRRGLGQWVRSVLREAGEYMVGAFLILAD